MSRATGDFATHTRASSNDTAFSQAALVTRQSTPQASLRRRPVPIPSTLSSTLVPMQPLRSSEPELALSQIEPVWPGPFRNSAEIASESVLHLSRSSQRFVLVFDPQSGQLVGTIPFPGDAHSVPRLRVDVQNVPFEVLELSLAPGSDVRAESLESSLLRQRWHPPPPPPL